jgi:pimeloyl-ACP methyl ester carboxylesterase
MPTITTKDGTEIFYKDWGSGQPIVFSHGWPLSSDDWDTQMLFFLNQGFRVPMIAVVMVDLRRSATATTWTTMTMTSRR